MTSLRKKSVQVNFRTSPELKRELDAAALRAGVSTTEFIEWAISQAIKEKGEENEKEEV